MVRVGREASACSCCEGINLQPHILTHTVPQLTQVEHEERAERDEGKPVQEGRLVAARFGLHVWQRPAAHNAVGAGWAGEVEHGAQTEVQANLRAGSATSQRSAK